MMATDLTPLLTKAELATLLKVSQRSIQRRIAEGMPYERIGRSIRFDLSTVSAWFARGGNSNGKEDARHVRDTAPAQRRKRRP